MKIIDLSDNQRNEILHQKVIEITQFLNNGGVLAFKADTVWGLGASAKSIIGINKLRKMKLREKNHPFPAYIDSQETFLKLSDSPWPDFTNALTKEFWPGYLTIVLPFKKEAAFLSEAADGLCTLGFRIPKIDYLRSITRQLNCPLVNTSANITGKSTAKSLDEIKLIWPKEQLLIVHKSTDTKDVSVPEELPSTVISINNSGYTILREGKINSSLLDKVLNVVKK